MLRIRPGAAGLVFLIVPPVLLYRGIAQTGTPELIIGTGLPALVLLSFVFLLFSLGSLKKISRSAEGSVSQLPGNALINQKNILETDPRRPIFFPGVRLSVYWTMKFGPFRHQAAAPLPVKGAGKALLVLPRRGEWLGRTFLRASDPFGFFYFDCSLGGDRKISVPPVVLPDEVSEVPGRPAADASGAPRMKENADERLERRSYVSGDDPRRLDWKVYARTGELQVKVGEESLPNRGRVWIRVVFPEQSRFQIKKQVARLDISLEAAAALIRHLENENKDLQVLLPGEDMWSGIESGWSRRLARSLPPVTLYSDRKYFPSPGERLWIISYPGNSLGRDVASEALNRGCRVSLGYPSEAYIGHFNRSDTGRYRRMLEKAETAAGSEGLDVRRI